MLRYIDTIKLEGCNIVFGSGTTLHTLLPPSYNIQRSWQLPANSGYLAITNNVSGIISTGDLPTNLLVSGISFHNTLLGLMNDDHTHYLVKTPSGISRNLVLATTGVPGITIRSSGAGPSNKFFDIQNSGSVTVFQVTSDYTQTNNILATDASFGQLSIENVTTLSVNTANNAMTINFNEDNAGLGLIVPFVNTSNVGIFVMATGLVTSSGKFAVSTTTSGVINWLTIASGDLPTTVLYTDKSQINKGNKTFGSGTLLLNPSGNGADSFNLVLVPTILTANRKYTLSDIDGIPPITSVNVTNSGMVLFATPTGGLYNARTIASNDVPNLDASKITTGTLNPVRLGIADPSGNKYLTSSGWVDDPILNIFGRQLSQHVCNIGLTTRTAFGEAVTTAQGTLSNGDTSDAPFTVFTDTTLAEMGLITIGNIKRSYKYKVGCTWKTSSGISTSYRQIVGVWDSSITFTAVDDDTLIGSPGIVLRYSTTAGDTNWTIVSVGSSGTPTINTGVLVATGVYYRMVMIDDASTIRVYLASGNGAPLSLVGTVTGVLCPNPSTTMLLGCVACEANLAAVGKQMIWSRFTKLIG